MKRLGDRWLVVVATTLAAALVPFAAPASATESFTFTRLAGNDRYETAQLVAKAFGATAENAVVATGETFPDALAGSYVAGSLGAPIVLTKRDELPPSAATALSDLKVANVTLLGGPAAVSDGVKSTLESKGMKVDRVAGNDRYETARLLAEKPGAAAVGSDGDKKTAILANGENYPDAIAAGPLSYAGHFPTLLTVRDSLSPAAKSAFTSLGIQQVLIVGGSAAIAPSVESEITGAGISVVRLAGANRAETAARIADYAVSRLKFTNTRVTLARGTAFPDALAGGPYGGKNMTVTLLAESPTTLGEATSNWLTANASTLAAGDILGGLNAISRETQTAAEAAAGSNSTAPKLTLTEYPTDGSLSGNDKPTYKGVVTDNTGVAKIEVKIDAGAFSSTGVTCEGCNTDTAGWSFTPETALTSATHTFTFRAIDDTGMTSLPVTKSLIVDKVKPTLTAAQANGGNLTVTAVFSEPIDCTTVVREDFSVRIAPVTNTSNFNAKNIDAAVCTAPSDSTIGLTLQGAPDTGDRVRIAITGEVKDRAGNILDVNVATSERTGTVSSGTAPTVTIDQGPANNGRTFDDTPTYGGLASDTGKVVKIEARVDDAKDADDNPLWTALSTQDCPGCANGGSSTVTWTFTTGTLSVDVPHTVEFRATDDSGDVSEVVTRTVTIDKTNPTLTSLTATAGQTTVTLGISERLDCTSVLQHGSQFSITVNGTSRTVSAASCANTTSAANVTITFNTAPETGDSVTARLNVNDNSDPDNPIIYEYIRDEAGNPMQQGLGKTATV